jgi:hypothetical protein
MGFEEFLTFFGRKYKQFLRKIQIFGEKKQKKSPPFPKEGEKRGSGRIR